MTRPLVMRRIVIGAVYETGRGRKTGRRHIRSCGRSRLLLILRAAGGRRFVASPIRFSREGKTMPDPTRPLIGVNADFTPPAKTITAHLRLAVGYVDAITAAGGLPVVLPPLAQ